MWIKKKKLLDHGYSCISRLPSKHEGEWKIPGSYLGAEKYAIVVLILHSLEGAFGYMCQKHWNQD